MTRIQLYQMASGQQLYYFPSYWQCRLDVNLSIGQRVIEATGCGSLDDLVPFPACGTRCKVFLYFAASHWEVQLNLWNLILGKSARFVLSCYVRRIQTCIYAGSRIICQLRTAEQKLISVQVPSSPIHFHYLLNYVFFKDNSTRYKICIFFLLTAFW